MFLHQEQAFSTEVEKPYTHHNSGDSTVTTATEISESLESQHSFEEFAEAVTVENIEVAMRKELHKDQDRATTPSDIQTKPQRTNHLPSTCLPSYMLQNAGEIWFPECRDCHCCLGFKHGCTCVSMVGGGVCQCVSGPPDDVSAMTVMVMDYCYAQQSLSSGSSQSRRSSKSSRSRRSERKQQARVDQPCRFFFSPMGCRHGDSCLYNHQTKESSPP
jgi:hypothetical protein